MLDISRPLGQVGVEILSLWQELTEKETLVSSLVHQLDKLQPILLAIYYEERGECPGMAQEFFSFLHKEIVHPVLVKHLNVSVCATSTVNY
jgi:5'-deoxynucleotidase YfbR-like HD superfamily hydrolase